MKDVQLTAPLQCASSMPVHWNKIISDKQISDILIPEGALQVLVLFKHSSRCSISNMVKSRLERSWLNGAPVPIYLVDVLENRDVAQQIALRFNVPHESPQLLLIKNGVCIYTASHGEISAQAVETALI